MDVPREDGAAAEVSRTIDHIRRLAGDWRRDEERAAGTLAIGVTTAPFEVRERVLARLLGLAGVDPERWNEPLSAPGRDLVAAQPHDAFLQLIDRERTYLSNVPVHTPLARVCRALVRLGVLDRVPRDGELTVHPTHGVGTS